MTIATFVYLEDRIVPLGLARIPIFDRGLLFGQAAYEVTAVMGGRLVDGPGHFARLARTLEALEVPQPMDPEALEGLHLALARRNRMQEGLIYLQVTAGDYGERDFAGPEHLRARLFAFCQPRSLIGAAAETGVRAITMEDTRWRRRDLKTTQLVSQALAYRKARAAGAQTAIFHEDGRVTEAASANLWAVSADGVLMTRDLSSAILPGITRQTVLGLVEAASETAIPLAALAGAREVFTTSTGRMILPVVEIDGQPVADGRPGPVTRAVQRAYYRHCGVDVATRAPWLSETG